MSGSVAVDVVSRVRLAHTEAAIPRVWSGESVRLLFETDTLAGAPIEARGVAFALRAPDGTEVLMPSALIERVSVGRYACPVAVLAPGTWSVTARCTGPSLSAAAGQLVVMALPAGQPAPATNLIPGADGAPLLSPSGALITF